VVPIAPARTPPAARERALPGFGSGLRAGLLDIGFVVAVWLVCGLAGSAVFMHVLGRRTRSDSGSFSFAFAAARATPAGAWPGETPTPSDAVDDEASTLPADPEAQIPRWRRPSLQAARQSSGLAPISVRAPLRFAHGAPVRERRVVDYRMVRVADRADDTDVEEIGRLDRGDEVDVLQRERGYALVRTPTGLRGWVVASTLGYVSDSGSPEGDMPVDGG
jgi:hypothetical protein